jgi:endonuclease NucS-like protein
VSLWAGTQAVGWHAGWGYHLTGDTHGNQGWRRTRKAIQDIDSGDWVVAALQGHRVGRIGQVVGKAVSDDEWDPLVPKSRQLPDGEMGRRIYVRWDLTVGPDDRDFVVALPEGARFTSGELRPTVARIRSTSRLDLAKTMNQEQNWVGLLAHFRYERALSNYLASYPHRLEDGLMPHPDAKVREKVFSDRTRLDVLLIDRDGQPVIVECKQHQPTVADIQQLRHYMDLLKEETERRPRGILVHGGAKKVSMDVVAAANRRPAVEVVHYRMEVDFASSV